MICSLITPPAGPFRGARRGGHCAAISNPTVRRGCYTLQAFVESQQNLLPRPSENQKLPFQFRYALNHSSQPGNSQASRLASQPVS